MDVSRKEDIYTIEDICALPDGQRAELIDGKNYYMAPPSRTHQRPCCITSVNGARLVLDQYHPIKEGEIEMNACALKRGKLTVHGWPYEDALAELTLHGYICLAAKVGRWILP